MIRLDASKQRLQKCYAIYVSDFLPVNAACLFLRVVLNFNVPLKDPCRKILCP